MKKLEVRVHHRSFQLICDADQSDHLRQLADEVDGRIRQLATTTPHASEAELLMLGCLMLADELYEARQETAQWRERVLFRDGKLPDDDTLAAMDETREQLDALIESIHHSVMQITPSRRSNGVS